MNSIFRCGTLILQSIRSFLSLFMIVSPNQSENAEVNLSFPAHMWLSLAGPRDKSLFPNLWESHVCVCPKGKGSGGQISFSELPISQKSLRASALRVRSSLPGHEVLALDLAVSCEPYRPHQTSHEQGGVWTALQVQQGLEKDWRRGGGGDAERGRLLRMCSPELAQVNDGEPGRIPRAKQSSFQDGLHWSSARHQREGETRGETVK